MQQARNLFLRIAGGVLFIGCSIQVVLGIVWMLCNLGTLQWFPDSNLYVEISKSFICDEYEGILYPLLVMLARGVGKVIPIPYFTYLYLLQLAMAFIVAYVWMGRLTGRWYCKPEKGSKTAKKAGGKNLLRIWGSLVIVTYPMAMQCHMAVLPESLVCSLLLLECYFATEILRKSDGVRPSEYCKVLGCFLALSLLLPEYLWIGAIPLGVLSVIGLGKDLKRNKSRVKRNIILLIAFLGMIYGMNSLTVVSGSHGRVSRSLEAALVRRCATGWISQDIAYWPDDVNNNISQTELITADLYPDNMEPKFEKLLEDRIGVERSRESFREIVRITWERYSNFTTKDIMKDCYAYLFSPVALQTQLQGSPLLPESYSPRNYEIMREHAPTLTMWYVNYHSWWFLIGLILAGVILVLQTIMLCFTRKRRIEENDCRARGMRGLPVTAFILVLTAGSMILTYALQGDGVMDYKKTIAVGCVWTFLIVAGCLAGLSAGPERKKCTDGEVEKLENVIGVS